MSDGSDPESRQRAVCHGSARSPDPAWTRLADQARRPATNGEFLLFMKDGGYQRPRLWLSDGWATCQAQRWEAPLYWRCEGDAWVNFTLGGWKPLNEVPATETFSAPMLKSARLEPRDKTGLSRLRNLSPCTVRVTTRSTTTGTSTTSTTRST